MKKIKYIFLLVILSGSLAAQPDSLYKLIKVGNDLYAAGKYKHAIEMYQKVLDAGYQAPELYYNIGNAYFRANNLAKAIVNYERALRLDPTNAKIKANLDFANQFVADRFEKVNEFFLKRWWHNLSLSLTADTWAKISVALFFVAMLGLWMFLFIKKTGWRKLGFASALIGVLLSALTLWLAVDNKRYFTKSNYAIVLDTTSVRSSPSDAGTELFILHEGVKIKVLNRNDGWYEVKLPNGSIGWIKVDDVEKI